MMSQVASNWVEIQNRVIEVVRGLQWRTPEHVTSPCLVVRACGNQLEVFFADSNPNHGQPPRRADLPFIQILDPLAPVSVSNRDTP